MARPFYPFVDNTAPASGDDVPQDPRQALSAGVVNYAARIAVYDDAAAAPRVVIVDPTDVRSYLEEITSQVTKLSHDQGGSIPFMVIREVVENFIHAYFIEPTITILDGGDTIRFSDQGPGIREKERALEYGTSSATEDMKRYIRGVGSGLPYAQQYMADKGGSLTIEDNISQGTVVTISAVTGRGDGQGSTTYRGPARGTPSAPSSYQPATGYPVQTSAAPAWQSSYPGYGYATPWGPAQMGYGYPQPAEPWAQGAGYPQPPQQRPQAAAPGPDRPSASSEVPWPRLSARGRCVIDYLARHDSVGPTELAREYGESQPTWTRELKALEEDGLIKKEGQKRRLTNMGRAYLDALS